MTGAIVWTEWHDEHITDRHKVTRAEVIEVVNDDLTRVMRVHEEDDHAGNRYVLRGRTHADRRLIVVVTVQLDGDLFPVTAYEPSAGRW